MEVKLMSKYESLYRVVLFAITFHLVMLWVAAPETFAQETQGKGAQSKADNQALIQQGNDFLSSKQYDKAVETFRKVIAADSDSALAYANLSTALRRLGRYQEALTVAEKAVELDPNYAFGYACVGYANLTMNRFSEAIEAYKQALHLKSEYPEAYSMLGYIYGQTRRYEESLEAYTQALRLRPNIPEDYNGLGIAYYRLGKREEGITAVKKAVSLMPNFVNAHINLGNWYQELGRYEEGLDAYSQVIKWAPRFPSGYFNHCWLNMYLGRGAAAADDARTFLTVADWYRERSPYMVILGFIGFKQSGRIAEATEMLDLAAKRANATEWPYPVIRYLRQEINTQELMVLATDNGKMTEVRAYLAMMALLNGQPNEAAKHFEWVKANGSKTFFEYNLTLTEMARLEKAKEK
jgi:tetratricopeptide (TPR) repeat protein